jgi:hypothetical protein
VFVAENYLQTLPTGPIFFGEGMEVERRRGCALSAQELHAAAIFLRKRLASNADAGFQKFFGSFCAEAEADATLCFEGARTSAVDRSWYVTRGRLALT